jgi:hypothetical protein
MAKISIYVTDELKARMDSVADSANWSETVRPAILAEIATLEHRKGKSMSTAIERLRASKELEAQENATRGKETGREWASNRAGHGELVRVYKIPADSNEPFAELYHAINPCDDMKATEVLEYLGLEPSDYDDDDVAEAFIEGASEVYDEIKDQL